MTLESSGARPLRASALSGDRVGLETVDRAERRGVSKSAILHNEEPYALYRLAGFDYARL